MPPMRSCTRITLLQPHKGLARAEVTECASERADPSPDADRVLSRTIHLPRTGGTAAAAAPCVHRCRPALAPPAYECHRGIAASRSPSTLTQNQRTPLLVAARNGHATVVEALLAAGADTQARNVSEQDKGAVWE